jgi:hypothetical protein
MVEILTTRDKHIISQIVLQLMMSMIRTTVTMLEMQDTVVVIRKLSPSLPTSMRLPHSQGEVLLSRRYALGTSSHKLFLNKRPCSVTPNLSQISVNPRLLSLRWQEIFLQSRQCHQCNNTRLTLRTAARHMTLTVAMTSQAISNLRLSNHNINTRNRTNYLPEAPVRHLDLLGVLQVAFRHQSGLVVSRIGIRMHCHLILLLFGLG